MAASVRGGVVDCYRLVVSPERKKCVQLIDMVDPESVRKDTEFASMIESDVPIVVQHTRLNSRHAENALSSSL